MGFPQIAKWLFLQMVSGILKTKGYWSKKSGGWWKDDWDWQRNKTSYKKSYNADYKDRYYSGDREDYYGKTGYKKTSTYDYYGNDNYVANGWYFKKFSHKQSNGYPKNETSDNWKFWDSNYDRNSHDSRAKRVSSHYDNYYADRKSDKASGWYWKEKKRSNGYHLNTNYYGNGYQNNWNQNNNYWDSWKGFTKFASIRSLVHARLTSTNCHCVKNALVAFF